MNHDTKLSALPELTASLLKEKNCLLDNVMASLWKDVGMKAMLTKLGFVKRSGTGATELVYLLVIFVWLRISTIGMFSRESLQAFSLCKKDALYELMNDEDYNWRAAHLEMARKTLSTHNKKGLRAFVLDDTLKTRRGKKMPGVSSHFDHTTGQHLMGQQVLTLGISAEDGFVPIDKELFISSVKAQPLHKPFADGRSIAAKRYRVANEQTKPEMAHSMLSRALRAGIQADYLVHDAWFGTKAMFRSAHELDLVSISRMKKNKMKYRHSQWDGDKLVARDMDVTQLYKHCVKGQWQKLSNQPYQACTLDVELNIAHENSDSEQWIKVRLVFVKGVDPDKQQPGKHDWAVFLSTDPSLAAEKILEIYALRWSIEVYFKEAKQHLGFLQEQSNHFAAYIASIHLTAIRYCLLVIAKAQGKLGCIGDVRRQISSNLNEISHAAKLWQTFRILVGGALSELESVLGDAVELITRTIDQHVQNFFVQALQLDVHSMRMEACNSDGYD